MEYDLSVPDGKVRNNRLFREAVGAQFLHVFRPIVPFIQINVQGGAVKDVLLALPGVQGLRFHPYGFEEVQDALRQEEAQKVLIKL